jgi:hypothetical protein
MCGEVMRYLPMLRVWDCGDPADGGHGYWDPEKQDHEYVEEQS